MPAQRFAVIGGGIIGSAVARELSRRHEGAAVTIYEKEDRLAAHQTGHNSGVVHAGLYYEPGSLKAELCRRGGELLRLFCAEKSLPFEECGKLVIAQSPLEVERLDAIFERARMNGVPGLRMLTQAEIPEVEPHAVGLAALHSPHTAIVDYAAITNALANEVVTAGGEIRLNEKVIRLVDDARGATVVTRTGSEHYDMVVACTGLQSDRLARASGERRNPQIIPFFGNYLLLAPEHRDVVNGLIYPVPDPAFPFLGVHLTKRIDGEMMVGPNAFVSFGRESYTWNEVNLRDTVAIGLFPGFWRFAAKNLPAAVREVHTVVSRRKFLEGAAKYVPSLSGVPLIKGTRGVRAQAMSASGKLLDDFQIARHGNLTHVRNAPSPGATSSLAIAEYIVDLATSE